MCKKLSNFCKVSQANVYLCSIMTTHVICTRFTDGQCKCHLQTVHGFVDKDLMPVYVCGRSCVEMLKMAEESLDALFAMKLPVPLDVARSLVEGIDTVLQRSDPTSS